MYQKRFSASGLLKPKLAAGRISQVRRRISQVRHGIGRIQGYGLPAGTARVRHEIGRSAKLGFEALQDPVTRPIVQINWDLLASFGRYVT
jgi:hypothetical protein